MTGIAPEPSGEERASLGTVVKRNLTWSFTNNIVGRVGNLAVGAVLLRILSPSDYGVYAVALVAVTVPLSLNDLGIAPLIVRYRGNLERIGPTATSIILGFSGVLFALAMLFAPAFASAMGAASATQLVRVAALALLIDAIGAVPTVAITRALEQHKRTVADVGGSIVGWALSIVLAVLGAGAWSLVLGLLVGNLITTVTVIVLAPARFRPGFDREVALELIHEGLPLAGSSMLVIGILWVDYIVVGLVLGDKELGFYLLAFNLSSWPINLVATAIRRVSLVGFARLKTSEEALDAGFRRGLTLTLAATLPACVALSVYARQVITFVYGDQWVHAADALRWLALLGAVRIALDVAWDLLVAVGRGKSVLWLNLLWFVLLVAGLTAGAHIAGIGGVGAAHLLVALVFVTPPYLIAIHRERIRLWRLARMLIRPAIGSCLVALSALVAVNVVDGAFWQLVVGGSISLVAYGIVVAPLRGLWNQSTAVNP